MIVTSAAVLAVMKQQLNINDSRRCIAYIKRTVRANFGFGPRLVATCWNLLHEHQLLPPNGLIVHFLMTLTHFKSYDVLDVASTRFGVTRVTFIKWVNLFTRAIYELREKIVCILYIFLCTFFFYLYIFC